MSELPFYTATGERSGEVAVPEGLLVQGRNRQTLHYAIVAYRANQRAGTASTKSKAEVAGTGSKPWKQKGTGRARAGYRASPIWRGGAVAFGPRPRSFHKKLTRKANRLAVRQAFTDAASSGAIRIVESCSVDEPKTKDFVKVLQTLEVSGRVLVVVENLDRNLTLASRNVSGVEVVTGANVNAYQLARYPQVIVTKGALEQVAQRLCGTVEASE
jgi:large subunit ribosomal protein L4